MTPEHSMKDSTSRGMRSSPGISLLLVMLCIAAGAKFACMEGRTCADGESALPDQANTEPLGRQTGTKEHLVG